jgi:Meiotically Up-regulated Gene 113 (MUG113) protein
MHDSTVRPDGLITVRQAATLCGVSQPAILMRIDRGILPKTFRYGNRVYLHLIDVLAADLYSRRRMKRLQPIQPPEWEIAGEPDVDFATMFRACLEAAQDVAAQVHPVVYYLRFADRIKIGTSVSLRQRLSELPHDELLATESGGRELEQLRHRQFAEWCIRGEWYEPADALMAHIARLAQNA